MATETKTFKDVLIDHPDGVEEYAWVAVRAVATVEEAIALATKEEPLTEGTVYESFSDEGSRSWFHSGGPHDATGDEEWMPCEPGDEGAVEFWHLHVTESEDSHGE